MSSLPSPKTPPQPAPATTASVLAVALLRTRPLLSAATPCHGRGVTFTY